MVYLIRVYSLFFLSFILGINAYTISPKPFTSIYSPHSILNFKEQFTQEFVGFRSRYSTCTGVFWFSGDTHIGVANYLDKSVQIYRYDRSAELLIAKDYLKEGLKLHQPENLAISNSGKILGIACNGIGRVRLYKILNDSIETKPFAFIGEPEDRKLHGVAFTSDDKYIGFVTLDEPGMIRIYSVKNEKGIYTFALCDSFSNPMEPLKPKSLSFSPDRKYVAIGFCVRIVRGQQNPGNGVIAIFNFDKTLGKIDRNPISILTKEDGILSVETLIFHPSGKFLVASDQMNDRLTVHDFDGSTGQLNKNWWSLNNPESELSFPHGIAFSKDGKILAVTNYGDDRISLFRVKE